MPIFTGSWGTGESDDRYNRGYWSNGEDFGTYIRWYDEVEKVWKEEDISYVFMGEAATDDEYHGFFRIPNVGIPQGSKIYSAKLVLYVNKEAVGTVKSKIYFHAIDNEIVPETATTKGYSLGYMQIMAANELTTGITFGENANDNASLAGSQDISSIVQEIVSRPGWRKYNAMMVAIIDDGTTSDNYFRIPVATGNEYRVVLYVSYGKPGYIETLSYAAAEGDDGYSKEEGELIVDDGEIKLSDTPIGSFIRFNDVQIDNGSIVQAYIVLYATDSWSNYETELAYADLYGVDADNPAAPTTYAQLAALTLTTARCYLNFGPLVAGTAFLLADVSEIVKEIYSRPGWSNGNAMMFVEQDPGTMTSGIKAYGFENGVYPVPCLVIRCNTLFTPKITMVI